MSDHVHEWWWNEQGDFPQIVCACGDYLEGEDILVRLNATERLGAEDALMAAHAGNDNGLTKREVGRLRAYATALEGEDD